MIEWIILTSGVMLDTNIYSIAAAEDTGAIDNYLLLSDDIALVNMQL